MGVHPSMRQFLDVADPASIRRDQKATDPSQRILAYRNREYIEKVGRIAEEFLGFMIEQRQRKDWLDDEVIGAIALLAINVRESFGSPQHTTDDARWTPEFQKAQFEIFDTICFEVQEHYNRNKDRPRDQGWYVP